jgi:lipopolysaccharide transport system permease protein
VTDVQIRKARAARVAPSSSTAPVFTIRPAPKWPHLDVRELWHFRELFLRLAWRDITVRYKQTSLGVLWAILQPLVPTIVITLVFGRFANVASKDLPLQVYAYSLVLPWTYFAASVSFASTSLVSNRGLVTKVYFPRVLLPLSAVLVPLVDMAMASCVLVALMFWYDVGPSAALALTPLFVLMAVLTSLGLGFLLSALNVRYRDVPYALPFLIQSGFLLMVIPLSSMPEYAQWVLSLFPMTAVINGFQWGVVSAPSPELGKTLVSVISMSVMFVAGLWIFRRSEPRFPDTI